MCRVVHAGQCLIASPPMCNLYSMTSNKAAIRDLSRAMRDSVGNLPPLPGIYPDYAAPMVRGLGRGARAGDSALGHAVPSFRAGGEEDRPRRNQHPKREKPVLAPVAIPGTPLPSAAHQLQ